MNGTATFGGGCFWCLEAVFMKLDGVHSATSGYMGGQSEHPTYKEVCGGQSGHTEVVQVEFDPDTISYGDLLHWFWRMHDPTTLNRQGNDVGSQYRSVIFHHSDAQRSQAEKSKAAVAPDFSNLIVTEIPPASTFYPAEGYHQNYYRDNASAPYCQALIAPKLDKLGL